MKSIFFSLLLVTAFSAHAMEEASKPVSPEGDNLDKLLQKMNWKMDAFEQMILQTEDASPGGSSLNFNHVSVLPEGILAQQGLRKIHKKDGQYIYYEMPLKGSHQFRKTTWADVPGRDVHHWEELKQMITCKEAELKQDQDRESKQS